MNYTWHCEDPDCGSVRESDTISHGEKPCGKCKKRMVLVETIGFKDSSKPIEPDPLEV
jgi:hypothetical protein